MDINYRSLKQKKLPDLLQICRNDRYKYKYFSKYKRKENLIQFIIRCNSTNIRIVAILVISVPYCILYLISGIKSSIILGITRKNWDNWIFFENMILLGVNYSGILNQISSSSPLWDEAAFFLKNERNLV